MSNRRRQIISVLIEEGEGLAAFEIAERIDIKPEEAASLIEVMEGAGEVAKTAYLRRNNGLHSTFIPTETGIAANCDQRFIPKERRCLCCGTMFNSQHAGNRICAGCSSEE